MPKRDPNTLERDALALSVPCSYCKAKEGEPCWSLRNGNGAIEKITYAPHRARIKTLWEKQYKDRNSS